MSLYTIESLRLFHPDAASAFFDDPEAAQRLAGANFYGKPYFIGNVAAIGAGCRVMPGVAIETGVRLGTKVTIGAETILRAGVMIGDDFAIGQRVIMMPGSGVADSTRLRQTHEYARHILDNSIVGPGVQLPSEVQIGDRAVIPTRDAITMVGYYGLSQRAVTINGGRAGAQYSVGCQEAILLDDLKWRVSNAKDTSPESAADYAAHMDLFARLGDRVQAAYIREQGLVTELVEYYESVYNTRFYDGTQIQL